MEPTTIPNTPFPLITGGFTPAVGTSTDPVVADSGAITPQLNVNTKFPVVNVAQETLSQSLNTETKRILGQYTFESLGAIAIGQFSQGVSGEIDISPDGIAAKNVNGDNTFTLDGTTGDATFKGIVEAGSLVSGSLTLGGAGNTDGTLTLLDAASATAIEMDNTGILVNNGKIIVKDSTNTSILDATGLISTANFLSANVESFSANTTTSASYVDVPGASLASFSLSRTTHVFIFFQIDLVNLNNPIVDYCNVQLVDSVSGALSGIPIDGNFAWNGSSNNGDYEHFTYTKVWSLTSGDHVLKLQYSVGGSGTAREGYFNLGYVILGS